MTSSLDVTGNWEGIYDYPRLLPPTGFRCELREAAGIVTGETQEPHATGADRTAFIEGRRDGTAIHFVKRYDYIDRQHEAIRYDGVLAPDGTEITGRWTIPGHWSGTFIMVRQTPASTEERQEISETVS